jgi:hypothetical protein
MPWQSVQLQPGTQIETTPTQGSASYQMTLNGRYKAGLFQKLGGWTKYVSAVFSGTPKSLWAWQDLNVNKRLSVATTVGVTVVSPDLMDITPQTLETNPAENFSTTSGDATVTIVDPSTSGLTTNDVVYFRTPVSVGGLVLSGTYSIATIAGASSYTIEAAANATANVVSGGSVPVFNTSTGSATVKVTLNDHAQYVGSTVVFDVATTVGGVVVKG